MMRCLSQTIRLRQLSCVGHLVRKGGVGKMAIEGNIEGRKQRGRPRLAFLEGMVLGAGCWMRRDGNVTSGGREIGLAAGLWSLMSGPVIALLKERELIVI